MYIFSHVFRMIPMGGMMPPGPGMPPMMSGVPPGNVLPGYAFRKHSLPHHGLSVTY